MSATDAGESGSWWGEDQLPDPSCGHHVARSGRICPTAKIDRINRNYRCHVRARAPPDEEAPMELRHLDTLLAIAEEGSFTAAADALNTVQSNVSDQIRQLEHELGVSLLVRGRRGRGAHRVRHRRARAGTTGAARARGDARRSLDAPGSRGGARALGRRRHREPLVDARARRRPPRARARVSGSASTRARRSGCGRR